MSSHAKICILSSIVLIGIAACMFLAGCFKIGNYSHDNPVEELEKKL